MKITHRNSPCPISFGLDIFGDKWSLLILRDIVFYHKVRYSDFANSPEKIATNILADRLDTLEKEGIIQKRVDPKLRNQYIYSATQKGRELLPIIIEMALWGVQYDPKTHASKEFIQRAKKDKRRLIRDIEKSFRDGSFVKLAKRE